MLRKRPATKANNEEVQKKKPKLDEEEILERIDALEVMLEEEQKNLINGGELPNTFIVIVTKEKIPAVWCKTCEKAAAKSTPGVPKKGIQSQAKFKMNRHRGSSAHTKNSQKEERHKRKPKQ